VRLTHFSRYDVNWGVGLPSGAGGPPVSRAPKSRPPVNQCKVEASGSIIECQNRVLGEELGISGTPYSLSYRSSRTALANTTVDIPITDDRTFGPGFPAPARIEVDIEFGGRRERIVRTAPYVKDQTLTWTWDRKDAFGHLVEGAVRGAVTVRYVHNGVTGNTVDFASFPTGTSLAGSRSSRELWLQTVTPMSLGSRTATSLGLGGWQLSPHGLYDPHALSFHTGRGDTVPVEGAVTRVVGGPGGPNVSPPGTPANGSKMWAPTAVAVAPTGKIFWSDAQYGIRSVDGSGLIEEISRSTPCSAQSSPWPVGGGNEIPASEACSPYGDSMIVAGDGTLYVADYYMNRVLAFKNGTARLVAGRTDGTSGTFTDGDVAAGAGLIAPRGLALDNEGILHFATTAVNAGSSWLVKVTPDGRLRRVAGSPTGALCAAGTEDSNVGIDTCFRHLRDVAIDEAGNIYVADIASGGNADSRIRVIGPDGSVRVLVGTSTGGAARRGGRPGTATSVISPDKLVASRGSLYYIDSADYQVRALRPNGRVDEVLGVFLGDGPSTIESGPVTHPLRTDMYHSKWMAGGPANDLFVRLDGQLIPSGQFGPAKAIGRLFDGLTTEIVDGDELHELDLDGRHVSTRSRLRGTTLRSRTTATVHR